MISNKMIYDLNKLPFFQQNVLFSHLLFFKLQDGYALTFSHKLCLTRDEQARLFSFRLFIVCEQSLSEAQLGLLLGGGQYIIM